MYTVYTIYHYISLITQNTEYSEHATLQASEHEFRSGYPLKEKKKERNLRESNRGGIPLSGLTEVQHMLCVQNRNITLRKIRNGDIIKGQTTPSHKRQKSIPTLEHDKKGRDTRGQQEVSQTAVILKRNGN